MFGEINQLVRAASQSLLWLLPGLPFPRRLLPARFMMAIGAFSFSLGAPLVSHPFAMASRSLMEWSLSAAAPSPQCKDGHPKREREGHRAT
jgi:hypothetical protein